MSKQNIYTKQEGTFEIRGVTFYIHRVICVHNIITWGSMLCLFIEKCDWGAVFSLAIKTSRLLVCWSICWINNNLMSFISVQFWD